MKNIIFSLIVIGAVIFGGYYLFKDKSNSAKDIINTSNTSSYATNTDTATTSPIFEDGTINFDKPASTKSPSQVKKSHMIQT